MKFKIGDKVKIVSINDNEYSYPFNRLGLVGKIVNIVETECPYAISTDDTYYYGEKNLELVELTNKNMNIKEQFTLSITPEPQKSFRKVGITNGDNILTDEGLKVFSSWLLNKHAEEFRIDVVVDMLKEIDKK
jgi:hypothetical protein